MNNVSDKLGVAVIGLGVGEQHARMYQKLGSCRLRWLYDLDRKRAEGLADALGEGAAAGSFEQILQDPQVDIVSIASFDDHHYEQVAAALEAGKHIFVEKPLSRTVEELKVVKKAWAAHQGRLKLSSNLVLRAAPLYIWVKEQIAGGEFGEIYSFDGDYLYGRIHKITHGWRKDVKDYSVMEGGGVHMIDLMVWMTGQRPEAVTAVGNRICTRNAEFEYNDYTAAMMTFPSGMIGRITANFGCVHRHHHVMRIFGTRQTFLYDDAGPRLHVARDPAVQQSPLDLPPLPAHKGDLIPGFVSAVLNDEDLNEHTQQMMDVISISAACDEAVRLKSEVRIEYA